MNTTAPESWSVTVFREGHRTHNGFACNLGWQNSHPSFLQGAFASAQYTRTVIEFSWMLTLDSLQSRTLTNYKLGKSDQH